MIAYRAAPTNVNWSACLQSFVLILCALTVICRESSSRVGLSPRQPEVGRQVIANRNESVRVRISGVVRPAAPRLRAKIEDTVVYLDKCVVKGIVTGDPVVLMCKGGQIIPSYSCVQVGQLLSVLPRRNDADLHG